MQNLKHVNMKIEIKSIFGSILFEHDCENNTIAKTVCEANLRGADLRGANLCGANLCGADLRGANLREANLREANLCEANLCGANLCEADLREANLCEANLCGANLCEANLRGANLQQIKGKNFAQASFSGHGECGRMLTAIKVDDDIVLFCGCFVGYKDKLIEYIEKGSEQYKKSRMIALETVLMLIEI